MHKVTDFFVSLSRRQTSTYTEQAFNVAYAREAGADVNSNATLASPAAGACKSSVAVQRVKEGHSTEPKF